jgi:serine protease Do
MRGGDRVTVDVVIAELPDEEQGAPPAAEPPPLKTNRLGIAARDLTEDQRYQLDIPEGGVLIDELTDGPAAQAGLAEGDVIMMLDGQAISDLEGFNRVLEVIEPGRTVAVLIQRGDGRVFYAIRVPKA